MNKAFTNHHSLLLDVTGRNKIDPNNMIAHGLLVFVLLHPSRLHWSTGR